MSTAADNADDDMSETTRVRFVRLITAWNDAHDLGSPDDKDMAAGRVLDFIKDGGFPRWHWVCRHLLDVGLEEQCPRCRGAGIVKTGQGLFLVQTTCPECHGAGKRDIP